MNEADIPLTRLQSISVGGAPRLARPQIEKTFGKHTTALRVADSWWPYPEKHRTENSLVDDLLEAKCDLTDILRKIIIFICSIEDKVQAGEIGMQEFWRAYELYDEVVEWKEALPDAFVAGGSLMPHVLLLQ